MKSSIILCSILFAATAAAQVAENPGPSILSRGTGALTEAGGTPPMIKPFLSLGGIYDTNLTPVSVDATGAIPSVDSYGGDIGFGIVGSKRGQRTTVGIDYRGGVRIYAGHSYYDSTDHTLSLSVTRQLTGRTSLVFREAAGMTSGGFGSVGGYSPFDPAIAGVPANELFDARTIYATSMANLIFQKSARLSFSVGGSGSLVRRRSASLVGSMGWSTNGDVSYRISRSTTLGADYSYARTEFTKGLGSSNVHSAAFNVSFRLGRRWDLGLRAGAARVAMVSLFRINFDPIIAAILGQTSGAFPIRNVYFVPDSSARLSRAFRRSVFSINYENAPSTGNEVFQTSRSQSATAGYSFTGMRRLNVGISAAYSTFMALGQDLGRYSSYSGGVGGSYRIKSYLHLTGGYDVRKYDVSAGTFRRLGHRATVGLAFSPGERPLPLR